MRKKMRLRWLRGVGCAVVCGCCLVGFAAGPGVGVAGTPVQAKSGAKAGVRAELSPWELAERGREVLEGIPEESRTKADYAAAMDGFRAVYHEAPQDIHAASAVYEVAELLAEQGRGLHDAKSSKAAVGQYEFLRTQYPGSSLRVTALLAEAQIEANDLGDLAAAKEKYSLFLKQYPGSGHAEEARAGLEALGKVLGTGYKVQGQVQGTRDTVQGSKDLGVVPQVVKGGDSNGGKSGASVPQPSRDQARSGWGTQASGAGSTDKVAGASSLGATPVTRGGGAPVASGAVVSAPAADGERRGVSAPVDAELDGVGVPPVNAGASSGGVSNVSSGGKASTRRRGGLAQVTGIRHWSTPTYTRVAIDLGDDVTYEAARVPNPDRIYFDLHGTRLAQELVGKSFAVTDDGFLKKIRAAQFSNDMTRVVLDVNDVTEYSAFLLPNPYRLIIDIHGGTGKVQGTRDEVQGVAAAPAEVPAPRVATVVKPTTARPVPNTVSSRSANTTEIAALSTEPGKVEATSVPTGTVPGTRSQVPGVDVAGGIVGVVGTGSGVTGSSSVGAGASGTSSLNKRGKKGKGDPNAGPARAAVPTADGETSLVRALGLKIGRIVIDAGHGGHDTGTIGVDGILEKDVVLDVALRVGKLLHDRLGAEVVYTRSDDTFIPLETRTAIANKAQADLFLSIHANSSSDASARGVETYYLNFTSAPDALQTAARENAVSDQSIHELSDLVKKIAMKDKIDESREFASDVESSLYGGLQRGNAGLKDRGVKKAPFVVLIGANMPSILAEISFVTNPKDANQLQQPEYRQRVAESLYKGVAKYAGGLSGTRTASGSTERASAQ